MNISKLPWRLVDGPISEIRDADNERVCDDAMRPPTEADMQFIVTACNAHACLVADNARLTAELETVRSAANQCIDAALTMAKPADTLTVRDEFALAVMQGFCANERHSMLDGSDYFEDGAIEAYQVADAMLVERSRK